MTDTTLHRREGPARPAQAELAAQPLPRFESPIVPQASIASRALVAVVAIMTFLASLTTGAVLLVRAAAYQWQADVAREVTIQVRPAPGRDIEADVARAAAVAGATAGIAEVRPYSRDESLRLLEPWLGTGLKLDELPVPRLIVVRVARGATPDLGRLRGALAEQVPGASLDDHRSFVERMRAMSGAAVAAGLAVLVLVLAATVLCVSFATSAAMAANRPVIEVLHLIGAKDAYIGGHFQRHFLRLGLKGGGIGGGAALALFLVAEFAGGSFGAAEGGLAALFGSFSIGWFGYAAVVAQVGLIALVAAAASRRTVNRTIGSIH
jgi:cell division transport system permease protein